ncbi:hypothetical protein [Paraburkholderia sp. BL10I2N1]|uniref:hypothetical protein n=1 Tax=Paraburkholderia sp. BL10I2N1 TaxID=1938796 RepID=UPI0010612DAC|nr:hypothetical protein [Paraburkholderia sp. BL10I2N1]TDN70467.1 hypothetical protein B0G77_3941 [Paraburkholderia sp. BL10I2N1]
MDKNLELLRTVVIAKLVYWDALGELEKRLAPDGEFSDRANNDVIDEIATLASALHGPHDVGAITQEHLSEIEELARQ